jgi:hypothetical protein
MLDLRTWYGTVMRMCSISRNPRRLIDVKASSDPPRFGTVDPRNRLQTVVRPVVTIKTITVLRYQSAEVDPACCHQNNFARKGSVARGSRGQDRAVISHQAPQTEAVGLPEQSWPLMRSQVVWVEEGEETLSRARPARPARSTPVHLKAGRLRVRMRGLMVTAWCRARAGQPPLELAWLGGSAPSKRWAAWEIADAETSASRRIGMFLSLLMIRSVL